MCWGAVIANARSKDKTQELIFAVMPGIKIINTLVIIYMKWYCLLPIWFVRNQPPCYLKVC